MIKEETAAISICLAQGWMTQRGRDAIEMVARELAVQHLRTNPDFDQVAFFTACNMPGTKILSFT